MRRACLRPDAQLDVHLDAATVMAGAAGAAHPRETGGLLLGWWEDHRIVIRHAVEVRDPSATATSWTRQEERAQAALEATIASFEHPWLGYVGDWHSHPAARGPSRQDIASIRRASLQYNQPLVLLVHRRDGALDHVVAEHGRTRRSRRAPRPQKHNL